MISICVLSVIYSCLYCSTKLKEFKSTLYIKATAHSALYPQLTV